MCHKAIYNVNKAVPHIVNSPYTKSKEKGKKKEKKFQTIIFFALFPFFSESL